MSARTARRRGEPFNGKPGTPGTARVWGARRALQQSAFDRETEPGGGRERRGRASERGTGGTRRQVFRIPSETLAPLRATESRHSTVAPQSSEPRRSDSGTRANATRWPRVRGAYRARHRCSLDGRWRHRRAPRRRGDMCGRSASSAHGSTRRRSRTAGVSIAGCAGDATATFVVVHMDSGELRQVGSGCLRDFLGGHDPERACRQAEYLALARERAARAPRYRTSPPEPTLETFAAHAAHVSARPRFHLARARTTNREPASADLALRSLHETPRGARPRRPSTGQRRTRLGAGAADAQGRTIAIRDRRAGGDRLRIGEHAARVAG